jgi:5-methylcytosine-specific restriction endonuclease McrA
MPTSRTGTSRWKTLRAKALRAAQAQGITNCPDCGTLLDYETGRLPASAEADHIIPHARGGQDTLDNIRICCRRCNQKRGAKRLGVPNPVQPATTTTLITW